MVEVPARPVSLSIDWNPPDDEPDWWDPDEGPWVSTGSWSVNLDGHGEILTDTQYSNGGFKTLAEAITATEKWATDRRMEITTFGVTLRAVPLPLDGSG